MLDRLWDRLGIGAALRRVAAGRRVDGSAGGAGGVRAGAQRALEPGSKLAATRWVGERAAILDCAGFSDESTYAGNGFPARRAARDDGADLQLGWPPAQSRCDIVFVDTTSAYGEVDGADELVS